MKKLVALMVVIVMTLSMVTVSAATPDFLYDEYNNYTATETVSVKFENAQALEMLLQGLPEEVSRYVDLEALIKSLFSYDASATVQVDISDDYSEMEMAMTMDYLSEIDANKNLSVDISAKIGMWMKLDMEAESFEIIYSHPYLNKYLVITSEDLPEEAAEDKREMFAWLKAFLNKETIGKIRTAVADAYVKYSDISMSGGKCTMKLDNEGFIALMNDVCACMEEELPEIPESENIEFVSFDGLQILGEDGITCDMTLKSGKISVANVKADVAIDVDGIFSLFFAAMPLTNETANEPGIGVINFTVEVSEEIFDYGKTKVEFPELTEENSFRYTDLFYEYQEEYENEDFPEYPNYSASGYGVEDLPVLDGKIYVPLRMTLESAYEDSVKIGYDNGVVTVNSDYFPGFKEMKMTINASEIYFDGQSYMSDRIHLENGVTYVSAETFEKFFGWSFNYASYDMIENSFDFRFRTENY